MRPIRCISSVLSDIPNVAQSDVIQFITIGMRYRNEASFILRDCIHMPHYGQLRLEVITRRLATHLGTKRSLIFSAPWAAYCTIGE